MEETVTKKRSKLPLIIGIVVAIALVGVVAAMLIVQSSSPAKRAMKQLEIADRYLEDMDYERAVAAYLAVLDIDPKNEAAYAGMTDAYIAWADTAGSDDLNKSVEILEDAIKELEELRNEDNADLIDEQINKLMDLYKQLCKDTYDQGKYDEAEKIALAVLEHSSSEADIIDILCEIYLIYAENALNNSDYDAAENYYNLVLQYDPDNETALNGLADLEDLRKIEMYENALREMARNIINDPSKYDFSDALILSDEYTNTVAELTGPVFFKEDDDQYIGVYPNGFIYYGQIENRERSGHGVWYHGTIDSFDLVDAMWKNDLPNGEVVIENYRNEARIDKEPGYTYALHISKRGYVLDGLLEGEAEIFWEMDEGNPHEWHVVYKNGVLQVDADGYAGTCVDCGATLSSDGETVETLPGL